MSLFDSRNTPITGAPGFDTAALPATGELLSTLVAIPAAANSARVQGVGRTAFAYRLDGSTGFVAGDAMTTVQLYLNNRQEIMAFAAVESAGGATDLAVQFFTGRTGPAYR